MYYSEVKSGGYVVVEAEGNKPVAVTKRLGADIALTVYDPVHKKAVLAQDISTAQLHRIFNEFPDYRNRKNLDDILVVRLVGGNLSEQSKENVMRVLEDLNNIDNGRNIINIMSADILDKPHPEAFSIDSRSGILAPLENVLEEVV